MPPADTAPLSREEAARLLTPLLAARGVAVAVSGGVDSLALLACVARWRDANPQVPVQVLTVDHRLRPEAAAEAERVCALAETLGLPSTTLTWCAPKPQTGIEAAARDARYRLMFEAARDLDCDHVVTAHHADDVAETFLMRLSRGAGVFGLAAMRPLLDVGGVVLFRPFLSVPRARLAATTKAEGLEPVEDPMNRDNRFLRARTRAALPALAEHGLTPDSLAAAARRLTDAAEAIDGIVTDLLASRASVGRFGEISFEASAYDGAPVAVRFRLLERIVVAAGGAPSPPRFEALQALDRTVREGGPVRSLAGALIGRGAGQLTAHREPGRQDQVLLPLVDGQAVVWDRRFRVDSESGTVTGLAVAPLGDGRFDQLPERPDGVPAAVLAALPAIFRDATVVAVPSIGFCGDMGVRCTVTEVVSDRLRKPQLFPEQAASR